MAMLSSTTLGDAVSLVFVPPSKSSWVGDLTYVQSKRAQRFQVASVGSTNSITRYTRDTTLATTPLRAIISASLVHAVGDAYMKAVEKTAMTLIRFLGDSVSLEMTGSGKMKMKASSRMLSTDCVIPQ